MFFINIYSFYEKEKDGIIEVANDDPARSIGYKSADIYEFSEELFSRLSEAYDESDTWELDDLWNDAPLFQMETVAQ